MALLNCNSFLVSEFPQLLLSHIKIQLLYLILSEIIYNSTRGGRAPPLRRMFISKCQTLGVDAAKLCKFEWLKFIEPRRSYCETSKFQNTSCIYWLNLIKGHINIFFYLHFRPCPLFITCGLSVYILTDRDYKEAKVFQESYALRFHIKISQDSFLIFCL